MSAAQKCRTINLLALLSATKRGSRLERIASTVRTTWCASETRLCGMAVGLVDMGSAS
jgi:hypothetical protein